MTDRCHIVVCKSINNAEYQVHNADCDNCPCGEQGNILNNSIGYVAHNKWQNQLAHSCECGAEKVKYKCFVMRLVIGQKALYQLKTAAFSFHIRIHILSIL